MRAQRAALDVTRLLALVSEHLGDPSRLRLTPIRTGHFNTSDIVGEIGDTVCIVDGLARLIAAS